MMASLVGFEAGKLHGGETRSGQRDDGEGNDETGSACARSKGRSIGTGKAVFGQMR
jgi:hypothetical protein